MKSLKLSSVDIIRLDNAVVSHTPDLLAVEEPLEIRLGYGPELNREQRSISVTMRTPGHDFELVMGFLLTEGIIDDFSQVHHIKHCVGLEKAQHEGNVVRVELKYGVEIDYQKLERHFYTSSSCGVCGKSSIEAIEGQCVMISSDIRYSAEVLHKSVEAMRVKQSIFDITGGLHAVGLFDSKGELVMMREDIGRHNALDKLIGAAMIKDMLPLNRYFILLSGRASFELIQKSLIAGIPLVAAIGAPSSLAAKLASQFGQTLLGFVREHRFNIYSSEFRIEEVSEKIDK
ncbi:MAG: formate dehydrogenase accessory sulfurtransferase FdhD [Bacteroidota bacterium]